MESSMTMNEFTALKKIAKKVKKHIATIGNLNYNEIAAERMELQALRETSCELYNLTTRIYDKHN